MTYLSTLLHYSVQPFMFPAIYNMFTSDSHRIPLSKSIRLIHQLTHNITNISLFHFQYGPKVFGPYWKWFIECFHILTFSWTTNWNSLSGLSLCRLGGNFTYRIFLVLKLLLLVVMLLCITIKILLFCLVLSECCLGGLLGSPFLKPLIITTEFIASTHFIVIKNALRWNGSCSFVWICQILKI